MKYLFIIGFLSSSLVYPMQTNSQQLIEECLDLCKQLEEQEDKRRDPQLSSTSITQLLKEQISTQEKLNITFEALIKKDPEWTANEKNKQLAELYLKMLNMHIDVIDLCKKSNEKGDFNDALY